jgi:hypothetical protein
LDLQCQKVNEPLYGLGILPVSKSKLWLWSMPKNLVKNRFCGSKWLSITLLLMWDLRFLQQWRFKLKSSGLWCHAALWKGTNVSEVHAASILREKAGGSMDLWMSVSYQNTIQHHKPEDINLHPTFKITQSAVMYKMCITNLMVQGLPLKTGLTTQTVKQLPIFIEPVWLLCTQMPTIKAYPEKFSM